MSFADRVYAVVAKIPKGKVMSYKQVAEELGTKAYQAVGQALKNNPYAPKVPCHRVIRSDGSIGGFNGKTDGKEIERKIKMLESEGVKIKGELVDVSKNVL